MPKDPVSEFAQEEAARAAREPASGAPPPADRQWFGHPRGLATLFFTEMWERFSYYGMRALLILFMTAAVTGQNPGLGFPIGKASAIYGLYTGMVYLMALPGGWVADKLWGARRAVFVGGCFIAAGHFSLAVPAMAFFYLGLLLIVLGTGLLKPNVSAMVGDLYPASGTESAARRDAGFSVFYMGINLGAFLGPLACGFLAENYDWHWGFSLAGIGMVLGLVQYRLGGKYLRGAGLLPDSGENRSGLARRTRRFYVVLGVAGIAGLVLAALAASGRLAVDLEQVARTLGYSIIGLALAYFAYVLTAGGHTALEKKRIVVIFWLFLLSAIFWSGFEQAGSSLNLFAQDLTDRVVFGWKGGWEAPASWLQSVNAFFIVVFAPVFGWLWIWLARRDANPSIPMKFALGLLGLAAGFFVLAWGAANASAEQRVSPAWLIVTYFFHTAGELMLSPVGLSAVTKLSPRNRVGQMMGVWFVSLSLGNLFAGLVAGQLETLAPAALFRSVALTATAAGLLAWLLAPLVRRLTGGVK